MDLRKMLSWIKPPTREDLVKKVNKENDTVLFTDGFGPNEINFVAQNRSIVKHGSIKLKNGKWSIENLENE